MSQVFGCPHCEKPFRVPDDAAGQTFECPSCDTPVEVPDLSIAEPEIYGCPHCEGKFAINATMYGQQLSCPHCDKAVALGQAPAPVVAEEEEAIDAIIDEAPAVESPPIQIRSSSKKRSSKKRSPRKRIELPAEDSNTDRKENRSNPQRKSPASSSSKSSKSRPKKKPTSQPVVESSTIDITSDSSTETVPASSSSQTSPSSQATTSAPDRLSVAHLLPPVFNIPDPVRFPHRIGDNEVLLPDGKGGYHTADANIVTITYHGQVYHLKRLSPEERRKRQLIHNAIAIGIAVVLIFLTLKTIGWFS